MKIEELSLSEITPYEKNPRRNDNAVEYVAESIRQFGFKVPLVIDENGVIVTGHTRYKAAQQLGLKTVPCIRATDLTPEQIKAFRLADNKVAEFASWDFELLQEELSGLEEIGVDLGSLGFDKPVDADKFFEEMDVSSSVDDKEKKTIKCPHCGEEIEI
ncbi:MAG: ParB N-terminal domain-containing protein [Clostridia bacterium]|nr:ParB N-terminal domain-containing protein [Clostridia bacterium]